MYYQCMIIQPKEYVLKNGLKVVVKTPEIDDALNLVNHIIAVAGSTHFLLSEPKDFQKYLDDIDLEKELLRQYREGKNYMFAVYLDGKIIANSNLTFHNHIKDQHRSRVGIAIQKEYWNLGIGTILFKEMIETAKNTPGIEQIELGVINTNERAKHLYEKMGFQKVGTLPRQLKLVDGTYYDEDMMVLFLA